VEEATDEVLFDYDSSGEEYALTQTVSGLDADVRRRLATMLRHLTFERGKIGSAMALAIDHAYAADQARSFIVMKVLMPRRLQRC
jgi:hypothetical protein